MKETIWEVRAIRNATVHKIGDRCPSCHSDDLEAEQEDNDPEVYAVSCPRCTEGYPTEAGVAAHGAPKQGPDMSKFNRRLENLRPKPQRAGIFSVLAPMKLSLAD